MRLGRPRSVIPEPGLALREMTARSTNPGFAKLQKTPAFRKASETALGFVWSAQGWRNQQAVLAELIWLEVQGQFSGRTLWAI